jgi:hypothetical protein
MTATATAPKPTAKRAPKPKGMDIAFVLVNGDFQVHKAGCADIKQELAKSDYANAPVEHHETEESVVRSLWDDIIGDDFPPDKHDDATVEFLHKNGLVGATHFHPCTKALTPMPAADAKPERYSVVGPGNDGKYLVHDANTADVVDTKGLTKTAAERKAERFNQSQHNSDAIRDRTDADRDADVLNGVSTPAGSNGSAPAPARSRATHQTVAAPADPGNHKRDYKQSLARAVAMAAMKEATTPEDAKTIAAWIHHLPTGRNGEGQRWWPEGILRPDRSDWK